MSGRAPAQVTVVGKRNKKRPTGNRWVGMRHDIFDSPAFRTCRPNDRALLWELIRLYNGYNNGKIFLSQRLAAERLGLTDLKAVRKAFERLQERGLIALTEPGSFSRKVQHASTWRLTFQPSTSGGATDEWKVWRPEENSRWRKSPKAVEETSTERENVHDIVSMPVVDSANGKRKNPYVSVSPDEEETSTQIVYHPEGGDDGDPVSLRVLQPDTQRRALRHLLKARGYGSQGRVAKSIGVSAATLSKFLSRGTRNLPHDARFRLAACLAVWCEELSGIPEASLFRTYRGRQRSNEAASNLE